MAKQISQKTFDDVVRENIDDFEMSTEDAMRDTIQQFESQGVNLSNIVKVAKLFSSSDPDLPVVHPVVGALQQLSVIVDEENWKKEEIIPLLNNVETECNVDLARRCLAGANDAYIVVNKLCLAYTNDLDMLLIVLKTYCALVNGQPDLLDDDGARFLVKALSVDSEDETIREYSLKIIFLTCVKHEGNRQLYVELEVIPLLANLLKDFKSLPKLVMNTCSCLRVLTFDDDIRVPYGHASDHAKLIVSEGNVLNTVLNICHEYESDRAVLGELFSVLGSLAVRDEFCKEVMDLGGIELILRAADNLKEKNLTRQVLNVLKALARNDHVKVAIVRGGGVEIVIDAMTKHASNAAIAEAGCAAITAIVLRNPSHVDRVFAYNGHQQIVQAMKIHQSEYQVQMFACMALRNLVARTRDNTDKILTLGAEQLINHARKSHQQCRDVAIAALRDLGCQVELRELWKGENSGITR